VGITGGTNVAGVGDGIGAGFTPDGWALEEVVFTAVTHESLFPTFEQVNFVPPEIAACPALEHVLPALTAVLACAMGIESPINTVAAKRREVVLRIQQSMDEFAEKCAVICASISLPNSDIIQLP
jgi:hypothetical protein